MPCQNQFHALHGLQFGAGGVGIATIGQIHGGKGAQRPVVHHVGVGNGQDHAGLSTGRFLPGLGAQPAVKPVLQVDHLRRAVHGHFGVHAMVGGNGNHAAQLLQLRQVAVHHGVKTVGPRSARRVFVLHVVGGAEVHQVRAAGFHQRHTGGKYKLGQVGAVDTGQGLAYQTQHFVDAIHSQRHLVGLFGRKTDAFHLVAQQCA